MAKVKKETIDKIDDFLDNLEQNEQARFDRCTLGSRNVPAYLSITALSPVPTTRI